MSLSDLASLNEKQLARVAYLFADDVFGTDADAYLYELKSGDVIRRTAKHAEEKTRAKQRPPINVTTRQEVYVTEGMMSKAQMHMTALAASIAQEIYQEQFEEVQR